MSAVKQGMPVIQIGIIYWIQPWNNLLKQIRELHKNTQKQCQEKAFTIIPTIRVSSEVSLWGAFLLSEK